MKLVLQELSFHHLFLSNEFGNSIENEIAIRLHAVYGTAVSATSNTSNYQFK